MSELVNKVAESGIITIDLESFYPREEIIEFDLKDYLFMGLIIKEKDFREALKNLDTTPFSGKIAAIHCSADAIIPMWAYMLISAKLQPACKEVMMGNKDEALKKLILKNMQALRHGDYADKRIVLKGCGDLPIPAEAYLEATNILRPAARSIMYGEPCSTVPVYKKKD